MTRGLFQWCILAGGAMLLAGLACCAPRVARYEAEQTEGTYLLAANRLYEDDGDFDIRKRVVYWSPEESSFDPNTNQPTPEFTVQRCTRCHECGFSAAWDLENAGKPTWSPRYRGEAWLSIVNRMRVMENSLLNEGIAQRIYAYLRDESLGVYNPDTDSRGAVVREVDELPEEVTLESPGTAERRKAEEGRRQREQLEGGGTAEDAAGDGDG